MDKKTFRAACVNSGYASSKVVTQFFKENPKAEYTEDDFVSVYRMNNNYASIKRTTKRKG